MHGSNVARDEGRPEKLMKVVNLLKTRIQQGDYTVRALPTELELASEVNVSRSTARKALQVLIEDGLLDRSPHGRLTLKSSSSKASKLKIAVLAPAFASIEYNKWRDAVVREAAGAAILVRPVDYVHWDDPSVSYALTGFDATFIIPSAEPIPLFVQHRLRRARHKFALGADLSSIGVPSIQLLPAVSVHRLGDYLRASGHGRIDCLNTQPHNDVVNDRLGQWRLWTRMHRIEGEVIDQPVNPYEHPTPRAYDVIRERLQQGHRGAPALLCITDAAATGAIRAYHEAGLLVGRDVAVCTVEGGHLGPYQTPSRTCLVEPPPGPYIHACLQAITAGEWEGPLLIEASDIQLFVGESTGSEHR